MPFRVGLSGCFDFPVDATIAISGSNDGCGCAGSEGRFAVSPIHVNSRYCFGFPGVYQISAEVMVIVVSDCVASFGLTRP